MLRRDAIPLLLAAAFPARAASLASFFDRAEGTALLIDIKQRRLIAAHGLHMATAALLPPGSTVKPFVLAALLDSRKLTPEDPFPCPVHLTIGRYALDCSHPALAAAFRVRTALAYSCNCFVAHFATRFEPGELARHLERAGLSSPTGLAANEATGRIAPVRDPDAIRLQALGEEHVLITPASLAMGYRWLALGAARPDLLPILEGLEDAVDYGTGQLARVEGLKVAGKTGSVRNSEGAHIAWFAGFAPSRAPEVAVVVALQGRSGGLDAAPVAGKILSAWRAGRL